MAATLRLRTALTVPSVPATSALSPGAAPPQALSASASTGALVRCPSLNALSPVHVARYPGSARCASPCSAGVISAGTAASRAASGSASRARSVAEQPASASTAAAATSTVAPGLLTGVLSSPMLGQSQAYSGHLSFAGPPPISSGGVLASRTLQRACAGATASACSTPRALTPGLPTSGLSSPRRHEVTRMSSCGSTSSTCYTVGPALVQVQGQQELVALARSASPARSYVPPALPDAASPVRTVGRPIPISAITEPPAIADFMQGYMPPCLRAWRSAEAQLPPDCGPGSGSPPADESQFEEQTQDVLRQSSAETTDTSVHADDCSATGYAADITNDCGASGSPGPVANSPRLLFRAAALDDAAAGDKDDAGRSQSGSCSPRGRTSAVLTSRETRSGEASHVQPLQLPLKPRLAIVAHAFSSDPCDTVQLPLRPGDVIEKLQTDPSGWTYGRIIVSSLTGSEDTTLPCGWFPESCLMPESTSLPLSVASHLQKDAQQGCGSGASTTADINSNSPNASDASKEAPLPWPSPSASVCSSVGQAAKRRQKPSEALHRAKNGHDEVTTQTPISVEEAEGRVEMATCLFTFLDAQEKRLLAEMAVQAGCQRQSSLTRLRLLRAKKAAAGQALREAQARARVSRRNAAVSLFSISAAARAAAGMSADAQQTAAQRRHRQRNEHLLGRASKRAHDGAAAQTPPTAGARAENRKRGPSRGVSETAPPWRAGLPQPERVNANTSTNDGRRMPRAVPPRTNRRAASRTVSPQESRAASPTSRSPRSTRGNSGMRASSSVSNLQGAQNSASTPKVMEPSPRCGSSSPRHNANSLMAMKLPRSLCKLLHTQDGSSSPSATDTPSRRDSKESAGSILDLSSTRSISEAAVPMGFRTDAQDVYLYPDIAQNPAYDESLQEHIYLADAQAHDHAFTGTVNSQSTTEEELRQACEALEESARAVNASERRVAQLQKAWEEAIAADTPSSSGDCESLIQLRSPRDEEDDIGEAVEDLDEYTGLEQLQQPTSSDDTAQLFGDVLQMAQELPARWQDMSADERLRLIGDFSRVRGLLQPHFQQDGADSDEMP